jgi:hypothetical protein
VLLRELAANALIKLASFPGTCVNYASTNRPAVKSRLDALFWDLLKSAINKETNLLIKTRLQSLIQ